MNRTKLYTWLGTTGLVCSASAVLAQEATHPFVASVQGVPAQAKELSNMFLGQATLSNSVCAQYLQAGLEALEQRIFTRAQAQLTAAVAEFRKRNVVDQTAMLARVSLAQAMLGNGQNEAAERLLTDAAGRTRELGDQKLQLKALVGLAAINSQKGDFKRAQAYCDQALSIADKSGHSLTAGDRARAYKTMGDVLAGMQLGKGAIGSYREALRLYESASDAAYDQAECQYKLAIALDQNGESEEANPLLASAFDTFDKSTKFHANLATAPRVVARWESGNPRARQIADGKYPLKYVVIGNLRVAATPVRSENLVSVIVSLANCGRTRLPLNVGQVSLEQLSPKHKMLTHIPPNVLDLTLEEEHVTDLTWRRRWLNHIQKTRYIPGYLKNNELDVDNFYGNNTFGEYGNWKTVAINEAPIVTREEFLYGTAPRRANDKSTIDFLSHGGSSYRPTFLDPGEAKTGLVFFQHERFDKAKLTVTVGNTVVEIPFDTTGPK